MRGILKESVRGALVRFFRLIIYVLIILLITFIVGLISGKKAKALVLKPDVLYDPNMTLSFNRSWNGNFNNSYFRTYFEQPWTNTTDYDLLGFHMNNLSYTLEPRFSNSLTSGSATTGNPGYTQQITLSNETWVYGNQGEHISFNGILFDNTGYGYMCWLSNEHQNTFMCPIKKNTTYTYFAVVMGGSVPSDYTLYANLVFERARMFYNYESTDIINSNGIIINQQQQTNQNLQDIQQQQQQQQQYMEDNNTSGSTSTMQGGVSDLTTSINSKLGSVNDLTQVVLLPITLFMDLQTDTCQPLHLVVPFTNNDVYLPCMLPIYQEHFGPLLTLFQTVIGGITGYWLAINIGKLIKEIVDCDNDRIEVLDL